MRRDFWYAYLLRGLETRLESRPPQSRARRRGRMDLEPCRFTFSRRHSDRRPLPCSRTSLEVSSRPTPQRPGSAEALDDVPPESTGQRPHREIGKIAAIARG